MTRVFFDGRELEVAIRRDGAERVYPLVSLAAALRIEPAVVRARIDALLRASEELSTAPSPFSHPGAGPDCGMMLGEPTEGTVPIRSDTVQKEKTSDRSDPGAADTDRNGPVSVGAHDLSPEGIARHLDDLPNTAAIAVLIQDLPPSLILDALHQALAIPATRLRTNRAALFTAIIRRMIHSSPTSKSYARTPTSTT